MGCFAYFLNSLLYSLLYLKSQCYRINNGSTNAFYTYRDKRNFKVPTFGDKVPVNPIANNVLQRNNTYKNGPEKSWKIMQEKNIITLCESRT